VDFNQLNKFIGEEMMHQAKSAGLVAGEQYGSRNGKSASTQSLNKRLAFDIIQQTRQAAIICSNDAKSCYDCIVHHIVAQCMYQCRVPKLALDACLPLYRISTTMCAPCMVTWKFEAVPTFGECWFLASGKATEPACKSGQL